MITHVDFGRLSVHNIFFYFFLTSRMRQYVVKCVVTDFRVNNKLKRYLISQLSSVMITN